jgi:hypothetical protein
MYYSKLFLCPLVYFQNKITAVNKTLKYLVTEIFRNSSNNKNCMPPAVRGVMVNTM